MTESNNNKDYTFLGEGDQGKVFQISSNCCIKVYKNSKHAERERNSYEAAQGSPIIPTLHEFGTNYIIIEYVKGPTLKKYLNERGYISEAMAKQILFMLKEMKRLGFTRIDAATRHIFVTDNMQLKIIDLTNCYRHISSTPRMLLTSLKNMGLLDSFLEHVKQLNPSLYSKWTETL